MGLRVITRMEDAGLSCSISKENKCLIYRKLTMSQNLLWDTESSADVNFIYISVLSRTREVICPLLCTGPFRVGMLIPYTTL